ncbi:Uma2 family endonuclease [Umezawaea sp. Da 62-37]|uniref:Uma2 family endonuclease n=1 Tax=Umezawaea sp. Da 62-37 TaxID=3075927 RepID=UPI0028F72391|nr:Uma2 family endonuclease [Umezawaea sp. Da 62-37]WNV90156.1 Uma2 family endonuclease [Umezawaea sp. Da 62-37]
MSVLPDPMHHLLTAAEYAALGEVESGYTELLEGRLLLSPGPTPDHNLASGELYHQLRPQLPDDLAVVQSVDVDLELAPPGQPGFSRRPDLVVVHRGAMRRTRAEGGPFRASEVVVAIEIVLPDSRRTDSVDKRGEYADAGIPHYWMVDIADPVTLVACHLSGEGGYRALPAVTGVFALTAPFPLRLGLDRLV